MRKKSQTPNNLKGHLNKDGGYQFFLSRVILVTFSQPITKTPPKQRS